MTRTGAPERGDTSVLAGLVARAAPPGATAVTAGDATLSYADLLGRAAVVAATLRDHGHVDGGLVGVCLPRSAALVVASLGVLRAGGAYVALDAGLPPRRLQQLVAGSGVALVLADADTAADLDAASTAIPGVGALCRVRPAPLHAPGPGLAYVMYTSGSTGEPKGVLVEQAGVVNLVDWHRRAFGVGPGDRCAQVAGPGFDAAAWEIWGALAAGAELVVLPESLKTDPAGLRDWLVAQRITVTFLPTPLAEAVIALDWPAATALRVLLTGGDRLHRVPPPGLPFALVNNYGLTEASVVTTSGPVPAGTGGLPSIGRPIDGVELRVVDADLREVPAGGPGELLIGGVSVARGYLGAPELTAARFVTLPDAEGRWYRTGDRVRVDPLGDVAFDGRLDEQVQVRGFRVEPAEVAAVLSRHPSVGQCVVLAVGADGDQQLVAYVQPSLDEAALRAYAAQWLPTHMLPSAFVAVERMPLTANGKIDRAALPAPAAAAPMGGGDGGDELETAVAQTVAALLGVPAVGVADNFLLLGGHSLLGAQLVVRLAEEYGVELSLRDLFDAPTAAGIAARVRELLVEQIGALDDETALLLAGDAERSA